MLNKSGINCIETYHLKDWGSPVDSQSLSPPPSQGLQSRSFVLGSGRQSGDPSGLNPKHLKQFGHTQGVTDGVGVADGIDDGEEVAEGDEDGVNEGEEVELGEEVADGVDDMVGDGVADGVDEVLGEGVADGVDEGLLDGVVDGVVDGVGEIEGQMHL